MVIEMTDARTPGQKLYEEWCEGWDRLTRSEQLAWEHVAEEVTGRHALAFELVAATLLNQPTKVDAGTDIPAGIASTAEVDRLRFLHDARAALNAAVEEPHSPCEDRLIDVLMSLLAHLGEERGVSSEAPQPILRGHVTFRRAMFRQSNHGMDESIAEVVDGGAVSVPCDAVSAVNVSGFRPLTDLNALKPVTPDACWLTIGVAGSEHRVHVLGTRAEVTRKIEEARRSDWG
jgi:hypothetical protein